VIERFNLLFAFLNFLSKLVSSVEVFADIWVFPELFDLFKLFFKLDKLLVENFFLILQFFWKLSLSFLNNPLSFTNSLFDSLRPFLKTPKTDKSIIINFVKIFFKREEIVGNGVNFVLKLLHCCIVFANKLMQLLELILIQLRRLFRSQLLLSFLIYFFNALNAITANLQYLFEDFIHNLNSPSNKNLFGASSSHLEKTTVDLIDRNAFNRFFCIVNLSKLGFNFFFIEIGDRSLIREQFL